MRGRRSKETGRGFRRETAREGVLLTHLKHPFPSLPFRVPATAKKKKNVFTRNIEILVKPSYYLNGIFVYISCGSAVCFEMSLKPLINERQCLTVFTNLVHFFS